MKLRLKRLEYGPKHTAGNLFINGDYQCMTLEDTVRQGDVKIPGETAIPRGKYSVELTYSPKFDRLMPLVNGVKGFTAIRIHWGNTTAETEGCVLVGEYMQRNELRKSKVAFEALFAKIADAVKRDELITLEVE